MRTFSEGSEVVVQAQYINFDLIFMNDLPQQHFLLSLSIMFDGTNESRSESEDENFNFPIDSFAKPERLLIGL